MILTFFRPKSGRKKNPIRFRVKKRISSGRTRWNKWKMTDLEKSMRTDLGKKRFDCRSSKWLKHFAQKCKFGTFFFFFNPWFWTQNLQDFFEFFEGAPLRGALGRAPPPFFRAEILKKFSGKSVLKIILYFLGKHLLKRSKTYLKRQISSRGSGCNFYCPKLIGERSSYDMFFSMHHFVWILPIFQFLLISRNYWPLFATIRHYSPLLTTIRHYWPLFATILEHMRHYSNSNGVK